MEIRSLVSRTLAFLAGIVATLAMLEMLLRVLPGESDVVLEVEDSGPGIPPEDRERVFSPFYRASATMQANPGGSGLGLAIVRDIAAMHHAILELGNGADGRGLLVRVRFPRATPPPAA